MYRRIDGLLPQPLVSFSVDGREVQAREGDSVALALMQAGVQVFRHTPVSGAPRAPLCMMGVCFDCLVQVDGKPNVQACMVSVRQGMRVQAQQGARAAGLAP